MGVAHPARLEAEVNRLQKERDSLRTELLIAWWWVRELALWIDEFQATPCPVHPSKANGAAQESNLPSDGLRRPTGFEDGRWM